MTARARAVTDTDIALLRALARESSVVAASRSIGISRDRAVYRIARLKRAFGGPVVASVRGGHAHGGTKLTELGDRVVRRGFESVEILDSRSMSPPSRPNLIRGIYHRSPRPEMAMADGERLRVAFEAADGEAVGALLDPEAIIVARTRFQSSALNVLPATVREVHRSPDPFGATVLVRAASTVLRVALTKESVRRLRLLRGARVWLYVKATALRRVGEPAQPGFATRRLG
jgi:molybdate transport repressor ModE-like protein